MHRNLGRTESCIDPQQKILLCPYFSMISRRSVTMLTYVFFKACPRYQLWFNRVYSAWTRVRLEEFTSHVYILHPNRLPRQFRWPSRSMGKVASAPRHMPLQSEIHTIAIIPDNIGDRELDVIHHISNDVFPTQWRRSEADRVKLVIFDLTEWP